MKREADNWLERFFEGIDALLRRLQCHCPKCGGDLYRKFSLLDRIALYLPIPHTIYATHQCDGCHTRFHSLRSLTDLFLEAAWVSALLYMGQWKPLALVCPVTWLAVTLVMKDSLDSGCDTIAAGTLTGVLWLLALVFGNQTFNDFFMHHSIAVMPVAIFLVLFPVAVVLVLDRYTTFRLEES